MHNRENYKKKKKKKRQYTDLEKIFASNVTEKGLADLQYKKKIKLIFKSRKKTKETFLQRRHAEGQEAYENVFSITDY